MDKEISQIQKKYLEKIKGAKNLKELDEIFLVLFGKKGQLTLLPKEFGKLSSNEKRKVSPLFNQAKLELEKKIQDTRYKIHEKKYHELKKEKLVLDRKVTIKSRKGYLHPVTEFEKEIADLFGKIGFSQYEAPHIDSDEINFQLLNIPEDHPARDLQDTFYIESNKTKDGKLLLRTHTSNSQIRIMKNFKPPFRKMNIGRCFRHENLDPRHEHTFEQFELVYVDKNVSMANLQYLSEYLLKAVFGNEMEVRLRPKYYPFVEPGAGVDGECIFCKGEGCRICGGVGWLELAGSGMIHPYVLKNGGVDPAIYSGIAWGFSPLRTLMLQLGIEDIRLFLSGDLKFLEKFKK